MTNKVALITGGTSGIGRASALEFARMGAIVIVTGRRETEGQETVDLVRRAGGHCDYFRADVSKECDVAGMVAFSLTKFGRLDCAFNNAGIEQMPEPLVDTSEATFNRIMDINVKGVWLSMKHEIPAMLRSGGGAIVNNASIAGLVGMGTFSIYVASKHAVVGMTKSIAMEFAKERIRVNAVAPGAVETPMFDRFLKVMPREALMNMHPIGRAGLPEEVAAAVVWLCSDAASFVTGHTLAIDGGYTAQ